MCGYDIKRFFESLSWLIDGPSFGSLYPALHGLLEDGLTTVEVVTNQDRPPRKIYNITDAGREALRKWMKQPMKSGASLKVFLMCLVLAGNLSPVDLRARLEQRRRQVAAHWLKLEQTAEAEDEEEVDLGERLTLDYGLALANAELVWLDQMLDRMSGLSLPVETAEEAESGLATVTV
jgi:DNA-binding PadR family transcriptional regulator